MGRIRSHGIVARPERKSSLESLSRRWEYNIKMDMKGNGNEGAYEVIERQLSSTMSFL
jgi:hypothetical protein